MYELIVIEILAQKRESRKQKGVTDSKHNWLQVGKL